MKLWILPECACGFISFREADRAVRKFSEKAAGKKVFLCLKKKKMSMLLKKNTLKILLLVLATIVILGLNIYNLACL